MAETLPALTIWQPWCSLIVAGAKPWEWRGWDYATRLPYLVGRRIALHAAARPAKAEEVFDILERIAEAESSLVAARAEPLLRTVHIKSWPLSSVLGTAIIGRPVPVLEWLKEHAPGFDSDRIDHSKFAWPLYEIRKIEPPVPARGAQGFWRWECGDG